MPIGRRTSAAGRRRVSDSSASRAQSAKIAANNDPALNRAQCATPVAYRIIVWCDFAMPTCSKPPDLSPQSRSKDHASAQRVRKSRLPTLFGALELATGKVRAAHTQRRRRLEFLSFMDPLVRGSMAQTPSLCSFPLYPNSRLVAKPDRDLVLYPRRKVFEGRILPIRDPTLGAYRCLHCAYNSDAKKLLRQRRSKDRRISNL